jgi:clan AA aspartic protease (TIGR02281 family)
MRGVEAIENDNYDEAISYLNREIEANPDNGYAYMQIARVRGIFEEYGAALTAANIAVKKIPAKDKEYKAYAYGVRGRIYQNLDNIDQAVEDFSQAISYNPDESDYYEARGELYYYQEKYDLSDKDYQRMVQLNEGSVMGHMGLGRNAKEQKKYDEAIGIFTHVAKLSSDYSSAYSFRAECYRAQGKYNDAIDDAIKAFSIDGDKKAFGELLLLADTAFVPLVVKLKVQKLKEPKSFYWPNLLGLVHQNAEKYTDAIGYYKECMELEPAAAYPYLIALCYNNMGDTGRALIYIDDAIALDSTDADNFTAKAVYLDAAGRSAEAIQIMDTYIAWHPENASAYLARAEYKYYSGDNDGAIEDYTTALSLDDTSCSGYMQRGMAYQKKGGAAAAESDFLRVIELDTTPVDSTEIDFAADSTLCLHSLNTCLAYAHLGKKAEALSAFKQLTGPFDKNDDYNIACLYSLLGDVDTSLSYLRKALEGGYRALYHLKRDDDLNAIRSSAEYQRLIKEYEEKLQNEIGAPEEVGTYEERQEEIAFTKEGGVCKVQCSINGLPLNFIFDTGASDVSISSVEATFMLKNSYLAASDILGRQNYLTADGNISEGTVINLRDVTLGNLHLKDVKASVVSHQSAPLLLGQSVLSKLGKIEIDNAKKVLRVTYQHRVE